LIVYLFVSNPENIADFEYSIDNGATWTSAGTNISPIKIGSLSYYTSYFFFFRFKNLAGIYSERTTGSVNITTGAPPDVVTPTPTPSPTKTPTPTPSITPTITPTPSPEPAPYIASFNISLNNVFLNLGTSLPDVAYYEYTTNGGGIWTPTIYNASPIKVSGLSYGVTYFIATRARKTNGTYSPQSNTIIAEIPIPPSPTPTRTPTNTPSNTPTPSVTPTPGLTPSVTPTNTPTPSVTPTNTPSNTPTPSITPSITPTRTPTPSITPTQILPPIPIELSYSLNNGIITIIFTQEFEGGSPITAVEYKTNAFMTYQSAYDFNITAGGAGESYFDISIDNDNYIEYNTTYDITIRVQNSFGYSGEATITGVNTGGPPS